MWNRNGFWLMFKWLEADRFARPREAAVLTLSVEQLHWLLDGIDLSAMHKHPQRSYVRAS
ncbi:transposase [Glaciimonas immobilis]|uniref:transposase n=1 Tax=Glaciimonas immobilis TaxID=728004 RepID=UPI0021A39AA4|nr:transposase [Glaciimonas immobilis]